jgi:hypothetical protein
MTGRAWAALDSAVGRRVSAGRLGEQLGRLGLWPVQDRSVAWFQPTAELPAASSPPAQHPRQGRERLTARPTPGRASYAADVSRCLETLMRCQDWNDRHRTPATCRARSTAAQSRSSGDSPATLRRPHSAYLPVPLPTRACPAPCSLGHEQFRDVMNCTGSSPETRGRYLAGVALADLSMTRPGTVRPTRASACSSIFFRISSVNCGAPLRNRTVDLLLTISTASCILRASCTDATPYRTDGTR